MIVVVVPIMPVACRMQGKGEKDLAATYRQPHHEFNSCASFSHTNLSVKSYAKNTNHTCFNALRHNSFYVISFTVIDSLGITHLRDFLPSEINHLLGGMRSFLKFRF